MSGSGKQKIASVSVIIPTYNRAAKCSRAVQSALAGGQPDLIRDEASRRGLLKLLERHRLDLQAAMGPIGRRIYLEAPRQFVDSLGAGWEKWKRRAG